MQPGCENCDKPVNSLQMMIKPLSVDHYIKEFPAEIQLLLEQMRLAIKSVAHDAAESISYGMPAYKSNGKPLVYFCGI